MTSYPTIILFSALIAGFCINTGLAKDGVEVELVKVEDIWNMTRKIWKKFETNLVQSKVKNVKASDGCACINYNCGCCTHIVVKKVGFDETICVNVSYLPDEYGVRLTLTINNLVLINQTISAKNPPPLCAGVPHIKQLSLCIRLYNLSVADHAFSGCVDVEAHVLHIIEEKYVLGCFKIGDGDLQGEGIWHKNQVLVEDQPAQVPPQNMTQKPSSIRLHLT